MISEGDVVAVVSHIEGRKGQGSGILVVVVGWRVPRRERRGYRACVEMRVAVDRFDSFFSGTGSRSGSCLVAREPGAGCCVWLELLPERQVISR